MVLLDKVKSFFSSGWEWVVLAIGGTIAVLLYLLNLKNKELEAAQAKIALAQTQKDADLIEVDIKQRLATEQLADKDRAALQQSLDLLQQKRQSLTDTRTTDQDKADYWNKQ